MQFIHSCSTPLGQILMAADNLGLTGLWFTNQKHFASHLTSSGKTKPSACGTPAPSTVASATPSSHADTYPPEDFSLIGNDEIFYQRKKELPVFSQTALWLSHYFSGQQPTFTPPLHLNGTAFQMEVWTLLQQIPYGQTTTYGEIARTIARRREQQKMSAQAVGAAVGRNPVSLIVPCHRVVGANGKLTGYAGGLERKAWLLDLEKGNSSIFSPHESY